MDAKTGKDLALCLSRGDGKTLWQKEIGYGPENNGRNNTASPSPITDGAHVWFYYGTGDLACFDFEGNAVWSRNIQKDHGPFNVQHIYASSPLLYKGKLYIPVLHRDTSYGRSSAPAAKADSYLLGVDAATGKDLWKVIRPSPAVGESREAYSTPMPVEVEGRIEIVLFGADCATGHDAETGQELWRFGDYNPTRINHWRTVPSACVAGGLVVVCPPKHGAPVYAIKPGGKGDVTKTNLAWEVPAKEASSDVCVPLYYNDQLYVLDGDSKNLVCLDPKTGQKKWSQKLDSKPVFRASPTGADGKIYCLNEAGDVWVCSAGEAKILSKASLGGGATRASVVVSDGQVFVRTGEELLAFGKKG